MTDLFERIQPKPQAYRFLRLGEIKPAGWLREQLSHDLQQGFVGHLDELVPSLIQHDDIYGADRLTKAARAKELGVIAKESRWEVQFLWWNSETQSNWLDGMARAAVLLDQPQFLAKARARIEHLLATQDADGYLGIYAPDLRFNFSGENGELWAQASLLRVLLGWYEATGEDARAGGGPPRRGRDDERLPHRAGASVCGPGRLRRRRARAGFHRCA